MTVIKTAQLPRGPNGEKDPNDFQDQPDKVRRILSSPKTESTLQIEDRKDDYPLILFDDIKPKLDQVSIIDRVILPGS